MALFRAFLVLMALFTASALNPAPAYADEDKHKAASFSEKKSAVPIKRVIRKIRKTYGGRLLEIKLEKERINRKYVLIYEAKILLSDGAVLKLYYNARNMKLLQRKGRYKKRRARNNFNLWLGEGNSNTGGGGGSGSDDNDHDSGGDNDDDGNDDDD